MQMSRDRRERKNEQLQEQIGMGPHSVTGCVAGPAGSGGRPGRDGRGRWTSSADDWDRFLDLVVVDDITGCWVWQGRATDDQYGLFDVRVGGRWRPVRAHRWAWERMHGPLGRLSLDHLVDAACSTTLCVRPIPSALGWHLEPVTPAENLRRRHRRTRQHKENNR